MVIREYLTMSECPYADCGWCYHPEVPEATGCCGYADCALIATEEVVEEEHPVDYICPNCDSVINWDAIVFTMECPECHEPFTQETWEVLFNGE
jgi:hypothetical protein